MTTTLVQLDRARTALAAARTMDDVLAIRDKAEAVRVYAKAIGESLQAQNYAAEIKLRAERRAGELLAGMEKAKGSQGQGRPKIGGCMMQPPNGDPTLEDLGVEKTQSSRWQREATVPEEEFVRHVETCNKSGRELTQASVLALAGAGHVAQSTGENEWYTPVEILDRARRVMAGIDLPLDRKGTPAVSVGQPKGASQ